MKFQWIKLLGIVIGGFSFNPKTILGYTEDGKLISLINNLGTNKTEKIFSTIPVPPKISITTNTIIIGTHINCLDDLVFEKLYINYDYLSDWFCYQGFSRENYDNQNRKYIWSYTEPEIIEFTYENFVIQIEQYINTPTNKNPQKLIKEVSTKLVLRKNNDDHFSYNESKSYFFNYFPRFIALATGRAVHIDMIEAKISNQRELIEILHMYSQKPKYTKTIKVCDMLFTFGDIKDNISTYLNNFIKKEELLAPVKELYFATIYNEGLFPRNTFLNYAQALETYHRRTKDNNNMDEKEHENLITKIKTLLKEDNEVWRSVNDNYILNYHNEKTFKMRIKELLNENEIFLERFNLSEKFVKEVGDNRNYHTHFDSSLEDKKYDYIDLYKTNLVLKHLLEICLLKELGIPEEEIKRISRFSISNRYQGYFLN